MFTLSQIESAHKKVQSGADFPRYAEEIYTLGVTHYDAFVADGHAVYFGNPEPVNATAKYDALKISENIHPEKFTERLKLHQSGGTDYMTFCQDCADCGIEKWTLDLGAKTCTYYDRDGKIVLVESFRPEK